MIVPIRCLTSIQGTNPVDGVDPADGGRCFQFWMPLEAVDDAEGRVLNFDPMWYSISLQTDGRLYWQAHAGALGVYDAYLELSS